MSYESCKWIIINLLYTNNVIKRLQRLYTLDPTGVFAQLFNIFFFSQTGLSCVALFSAVARAPSLKEKYWVFLTP